MLDFAIFAVTFVVGLIMFLIWIYPSGKAKPTTVPGEDPSDEREGNFPDIGRAGSLHEYLVLLHDKHGPITSFWWGQQYVVSIASADLFKEGSHVFNRPREQFMMFEPLITLQCIQYANEKDGKQRRNLYDPSFSHDMIKSYFPAITDAANQLANKWDSLSADEHIPLSQYMLALALKSVTQACFGGFFKNDEAKILEFKADYDLCWEEMENRLTGSMPVQGDGRVEKFNKCRDGLYEMIRDALAYRKAHPAASPQEEVLIDTMISSGLPDDVIFADCLVYVIGGFHTTGNLMTWCLYYLAENPTIQEKVYEELVTVVGKEGEVSPSDITQLVYCRQVIDETLRCSVLAPWAARYCDEDIKLGGHIIPKQTPIIHALGVSLCDEDVWPEPDKFDPDRFDPDEVKDRHSFAFRPFGFAGKRICPGYRFAYAEAHLFLAVLARKFVFHLIEGQVVKKRYGLVTHPEEEVWIHIEKR